MNPFINKQKTNRKPKQCGKTKLLYLGANTLELKL